MLSNPFFVLFCFWVVTTTIVGAEFGLFSKKQLCGVVGLQNFDK